MMTLSKATLLGRLTKIGRPFNIAADGFYSALPLVIETRAYSSTLRDEKSMAQYRQVLYLSPSITELRGRASTLRENGRICVTGELRDLSATWPDGKTETRTVVIADELLDIDL